MINLIVYLTGNTKIKMSLATNDINEIEMHCKKISKDGIFYNPSNSTLAVFYPPISILKIEASI